MAENGSIIEVEVDEAMLRAIELKLGSLRTKAPRALKNAVNATARDAKKDLAAKAQQRYVIKSTKFKKAIKQKNATIAKPTAILNVSGAPQPLINFQTKKNTKYIAAKARGRNDRSLKELISSRGGKAFTATFKMGGKNHDVVNKKAHNEIMQRESKARLPLKTFYGPSDPVMVGNDEVYGKIEPDIQKMLLKEINTQIRKILGG